MDVQPVRCDPGSVWFAGDKQFTRGSLGVTINFDAGGMLAFASVMLLLAWRGSAKATKAAHRRAPRPDRRESPRPHFKANYCVSRGKQFQLAALTRRGRLRFRLQTLFRRV